MSTIISQHAGTKHNASARDKVSQEGQRPGIMDGTFSQICPEPTAGHSGHSTSDRARHDPLRLSTVRGSGSSKLPWAGTPSDATGRH